MEIYINERIINELSEVIREEIDNEIIDSIIYENFEKEFIKEEEFKIY
jgi:hypothetical protein